MSNVPPPPGSPIPPPPGQPPAQPAGQPPGAVPQYGAGNPAPTVPFTPHGGAPVGQPPGGSGGVVSGPGSSGGGRNKGLLALIGALVVAALAVGAYFLFFKDDDDNEVVVNNSQVVPGTGAIAADGSADAAVLAGSVKAVLDQAFAGGDIANCPIGDIKALAAKAPASLNAATIAAGGQTVGKVTQKTARVLFCRGTSADDQTVAIFAGDPYDAPSHNQGVEDAFNANAPHTFDFGKEEDFNGGKLQSFCATETSNGKVTCRADWFNDDSQFGLSSNGKGVTQEAMVQWFKAAFADLAQGIVNGGTAAGGTAGTAPSGTGD